MSQEFFLSSSDLIRPFSFIIKIGIGDLQGGLSLVATFLSYSFVIQSLLVLPFDTFRSINKLHLSFGHLWHIRFLRDTAKGVGFVSFAYVYTCWWLLARWLSNCYFYSISAYTFGLSIHLYTAFGLQIWLLRTFLFAGLCREGRLAMLDSTQGMRRFQLPILDQSIAFEFVKTLQKLVIVKSHLNRSVFIIFHWQPKWFHILLYHAPYTSFKVENIVIVDSRWTGFVNTGVAWKIRFVLHAFTEDLIGCRIKRLRLWWLLIQLRLGARWELRLSFFIGLCTMLEIHSTIFLFLAGTGNA